MSRPRFEIERSTRRAEAAIALLGVAVGAPTEVGARAGPITSADFSSLGAFRLECGDTSAWSF